MQDFLPGDLVKIAGTRSEAQILEGPNRKGEYLLLSGAVRIWVNASQLRQSDPKKRKQKKRSKPNHTSIDSSATCASIDLHGFTVQEAKLAVERALDRALVNGHSQLLIIHGIGSGKVKHAVHEYLAASRHIAKFNLEEGNPGTTRAYL